MAVKDLDVVVGAIPVRFQVHVHQAEHLMMMIVYMTLKSNLV